MDGENNGKPYIKMDHFGGKTRYFWKHPYQLVVFSLDFERTITSIKVDLGIGKDGASSHEVIFSWLLKADEIFMFDFFFPNATKFRKVIQLHPPKTNSKSTWTWMSWFIVVSLWDLAYFQLLLLSVSGRVLLASICDMLCSTLRLFLQELPSNQVRACHPLHWGLWVFLAKKFAEWETVQWQVWPNTMRVTNTSQFTLLAGFNMQNVSCPTCEFI